MKKVTRRNLICVVVAFVVVIGVLLSFFSKKDIGTCTKYKCDVVSNVPNWIVREFFLYIFHLTFTQKYIKIDNVSKLNSRV